MARRRIQFGSIVHLRDVLDPEGRPVDPHRGVVISSDQDIADGRDLWMAIITGSSDRPARDGWFELDYVPGHPHPETGLDKYSVAKGTWLVRKPQSECVFTGKRIKLKQARELREWIDRKIAESAAQK